MATQTPTQRKAAARKAAATRKRNATARRAKTTQTSAQRTADNGLGTGVAGLEVVAAQAERAVLIPVGAALVARDSLVEAAKPYFTNRESAERELTKLQRQVRTDLRKFERRGNTARNRVQRQVKRTRTRVERELRQRRTQAIRFVRRNRREAERQVKSARRDAERQVKTARREVERQVERVQDQVTSLAVGDQQLTPGRPERTAGVRLPTPGFTVGSDAVSLLPQPAAPSGAVGLFV